MLQLEQNNVQLQSHAKSKEQAIQEVGNLLVKNQFIKSGYVNSMLSREKVANTYLGNGIAIPHGLPKDRELILRTGISVLQVPEGVEWNRGEIVYLVVGIAARSDEHLGILANLTNVLNDEEVIGKLTKTNDIRDIISTLSKSREAASAPVEIPSDFPAYIDLTILNPTGLHARPATTFASLAKEFASEVRVRHGDKVANGKSMASLLQLGLENNSVIRVMAKGPDEAAALQALKEAVESGLGEEEKPVAAQAARPAYEWEPEPGETVMPGIPASPGLAIGPLRFLKRSKFVVETTAKDPEVEKTGLMQAVESAKTQLNDLYNEVKQRSGADEASIFLAHAEFLEDPDLRGCHRSH